jgi:uncharacterized protein (DUF2147 family)
MKKLAFILIILVCFQSNAQSVLGKWKTIDDKTGKSKSVVEIYELNGKVYGKIIEIVDPTKRDRKCDKCDGSDKNKHILGLVIIKGLTKDGEEYNGGKIMDPESGNIYSCYIKIIEKNKLLVRAFKFVTVAGRSQTWIRV